jgi:hypothetical protein
MDIGFRVYFLGDDGSLRGIPWPLFVGLYAGISSISFPEYAKKNVKSVHVVIEMADGSPLEILETVFFLTYFDHHGHMGKKTQTERVHIKPSYPVKPCSRESHKVLNFMPRLSPQHLVSGGFWSPTEEEAAGLVTQIKKQLGL